MLLNVIEKALSSRWEFVKYKAKQCVSMFADPHPNETILEIPTKKSIYGDAGVYWFGKNLRMYLNGDLMKRCGIDESNHLSYLAEILPSVKDDDTITILFRQGVDEGEHLYPVHKRKGNRTQYQILLQGRSWLRKHPHKTRYVVQSLTTTKEDKLLVLRPYSRDQVLL